MQKKTRTMKTAAVEANPPVKSPMAANNAKCFKTLLPLSSAAEIALQKAVCFIHPSHGQGLSCDEYYEAVSVILEQACLAIVAHKATGMLTYERKKGRRKVRLFYSATASDCWPPAFDLRSETEDERFARLVLSAH